VAKFEAIEGGRSIKSMPLYVDLHRIANELAELGIEPGQPLTASQLYPFDQLHYHGTDAVRAAAGLIGLGRDSRVLEIGSGLGGPARYLAATVGCHVTALELQPELHDLAASLTQRAGLAPRVDHVRGDALSFAFPDHGFDAVVSWLALHHISQRRRLLQRLVRTLRPNGRLFVEDLVVRAPFAAADIPAVRHTLYGVTMTSAADYAADVGAAGFHDVETTDMTVSWATFCTGRAAAFAAGRERHERVHGADTAARLEGFFTTVDRLFASGSLGGIRITARR
jgi:cyclopropane fatty-acyl-phospholipid synthase-like methyltransferase